MEFDDLLTNHVGEFGHYQKIIFILISLTAVASAFTTLGIIFVAAVPKHRCEIPRLEVLGLDEQELLNLSIPFEYGDDGKKEYSSCRMYDRDYENLSFTQIEFRMNATEIKCEEGWHYSRDIYQATIVTEWDLVCDQKWLQAAGSSVYMAGIMVGALVSGSVSDMFGRKKTLFGGILGLSVMQLTSSFSTNVIIFMVLRFFLAIFDVTCYSTGFVTVVEMVGPKWRLHTGIMFGYFFSIGYMLLPLVAYFVQDWRQFQWVVGVPMAAFLLLWWIVPESARWLYTKNRHDEANKIVQKMAKTNKAQLPSEFKINETKDEQTGSIFDLYKIKELRRITMNVCWNWCVNSMVYYGLSLNTSSFGGNPYVNCFIAGAVEIPAYIFVQLNPLCCGRRVSLAVTMILAGISLIMTIFIPQGLEWVSISLAMLGKFAISASFAIIYVFTAELYPTQVRHIAVGNASVFARIGGIAAPFIGSLSHSFVPMIFFGVCSILAGGLALLLPETKDKKLSQHLDEVKGRVENNEFAPNLHTQNGISTITDYSNQTFEKTGAIDIRL